MCSRTRCWSGHSSQPAPPFLLGLPLLSTHCAPGTVGGGGGGGPARGSCGPRGSVPGLHVLSQPLRTGASCPGVCSLGTVPRVCLHPSWASPGSPAPLTPAVVLALNAPCPRAAVAEPTQRLSVPRGLAVFRSFAGRDSPGVMACVLSVAQGQQVGLGLMGLIKP